VSRQLSILALLVIFALGCKQNKKEAPASEKVITPDSIKNQAQEVTVNPYASVDISPMDMSYFPCRLSEDKNGPCQYFAARNESYLQSPSPAKAGII
jgi:hypothetical protein